MSNLKQALEGLLKESGHSYAVSSDLDRCIADLRSVLIRLQDLGCAPLDIIRELRIEYEESVEHLHAKPHMFNEQVPLPPGLEISHLREAMDYTTGLIAAMNRDLREGVGRPLPDFIQANNFSGIVSNILTDGMHKFSPFKHNHDQRYPDLKTEDGVGLEMKAANKAGKGGESHNAHGGWHLIACFDLAADGNITFVQIEIANLVSHQDEPNGDWKYCGSKVSDSGSQRTETYYTTNRGTWKLRDGSIYLDTDLVTYKRWRRQGVPMPAHSPLHELRPS